MSKWRLQRRGKARLEGHGAQGASLFFTERGNRLFVLLPESEGNGLSDVFQRTLNIFAFGSAARQGWALDHDSSVVALLNRHMKDHRLASLHRLQNLKNLNLTLATLSEKAREKRR